MAVPGHVKQPERLRTGEVGYESDGFEISAYLARPPEPATYPAIIVIHEAFGPVEHIRDVARRFANVGFIALAPNLYTRIGTPDPADTDAVVAAMFGLPDGQTVRDLEAGARYLRRQPDVRRKIGVIGFCSGGRHALLLACSSDAFDAAIDCWGGFITSANGAEDTTEARPTPPIDLVANLSCPLLVVAGREDDNATPEDAEAVGKRGEEAGKDVTVRIFADAGHAFFADYRPTYRERPAQELWPQLVSFFKTHLE